MPINNIETQEFVICGCPRTGTTALMHLLNHSHKVFVTNELGNYTWGDDWNLRLKYAKDDSLLMDYFHSKQIDIDKVAQYSNNRTFFEVLSEQYKIPIVGDKYHSYALKHDFECIRSYKPDIKFIFTIRDPKAVIASSLRSKEKNIWSFSSLEQAAQMWYNYNLAIFRCIDKLDKSQYLVLRYEDCCKNLTKMIRKLSIFFEEILEFEENPESLYIPTNLDTWKTELKSLSYRIPKHVQSLMELMGY